MGLPELSALLLRERQVLLRAMNRPEALGALREVGLARAVEAQAVALDLGLPAGADLCALAAAAPAPWDGVLAEHHQALTTLVHGPAGRCAPQPLRDAVGT